MGKLSQLGAINNKIENNEKLKYTKGNLKIFTKECDCMKIAKNHFIYNNNAFCYIRISENSFLRHCKYNYACITCHSITIKKCRI